MPRGGVTDAAMPTILPARAAPARGRRALERRARGRATRPLSRVEVDAAGRRRPLQRLRLVDADRDVHVQSVGVVAHEVLVVGRHDQLVVRVEVAPAHAHQRDAVGEGAHRPELGHRRRESEQR